MGGQWSELGLQFPTKILYTPVDSFLNHVCDGLAARSIYIYRYSLKQTSKSATNITKLHSIFFVKTERLIWSLSACVGITWYCANRWGELQWNHVDVKAFPVREFHKCVLVLLKIGASGSTIAHIPADRISNELVVRTGFAFFRIYVNLSFSWRPQCKNGRRKKIKF